MGIVDIGRSGEVGGETSGSRLSEVCLRARHAGFLVWLRWESRYLG